MLGVLPTFSGKNATRDAHTHHDHLRLYSAGLQTSPTPLTELRRVLQPWSLPTALSVGGGNLSVFSAVCYYFGVALWEARGVPVGLIASDFGSTSVEAWSPPQVMDECGLPHTPHAPPDQCNSPSGLYNGMISPLLSLSIFGALFYQGEHDSMPVNHSETYVCAFPAMVRSWRQSWHKHSSGGTPATFPFGFVQLSDVNCLSNETCGDGARYHDSDSQCGWPNIRWGQTANVGFVPNALMLNTFMAVSTELGDAASPFTDVHPRWKKPVGECLVLGARAIAYGESDLYWTGPLVQRVSLLSATKEVLVNFRLVGAGGLLIKHSVGFELRVGQHWLQAPIARWNASSLVLHIPPPLKGGNNDTVSAVRYNWYEGACLPLEGPYRCAVYAQAEELPAPPFIHNVSLKTDDTQSVAAPLARVLLLMALLGTVASDVSSVDVFVHGEHPLCRCLRIPSLVATNTTLVAFSECRTWGGDGCDPLEQAPLGLAADGINTRIVMKTSTTGGALWSPIVFLVNATSQPTSVWDAERGTLFLMFQSHVDAGAAHLMQSNSDAAIWSEPRCVVSQKQEANGRPIFPGPGNAIVLSSTHPFHPGRLVFPAWLGPDGPKTSASLFFSDDSGLTFQQTQTTWPKSGNDESTVTELSSGALLYLTRASYVDSKHHLGVARSIAQDAGSHFILEGRQQDLSGTPDDISVTSLTAPLPFSRSYFAWRPERNTPCVGAGTEVRRWGSTATAIGSTFMLGGNVSRTSRVLWANLSITSNDASARGLWLEGAPGPSHGGKCSGAASYSSIECGAVGHSTGRYTSTCFDLVPLHAGAPPLRYGDAVLLQESPSESGQYLNPADACFTAMSASSSAAWTLVSVAQLNSTAAFVGGAFALRPGVKPFAPLPPPPRMNKTLYLSHSENTNFTSRTNGTVRASDDGGLTWPWTFRATIGTTGSVFSRQAFAYSCLSSMPAHSPFGTGAFLGMLWESSTTDCTGMDASCAIKFSVVPGVPSADSDNSNGWTHRTILKTDDSGVSSGVWQRPAPAPDSLSSSSGHDGDGDGGGGNSGGGDLLASSPCLPPDAPCHGMPCCKNYLSPLEGPDASCNASTPRMPGAIDVFVGGGVRYSLHRIPALVRAKDGSLLVFAQAAGLPANSSDVVLKRSSTSGISWGAEQVVVRQAAVGGLQVANPSPVVLASGRVLLVCTPGNKEVWNFGSDTHGVSWSSGRNITAQASRSEWTWVATGPPQGLLLTHGKHAGRVVIGADHRSKGSAGSHAIFSDSGGKNWHISTLLDDSRGPCESQVAVTPNGSLLINMRSHASVRLFAWSVTGGATWGPLTDKPFHGLKYGGGYTEGSTIAMSGSDLLAFSTPFLQPNPLPNSGDDSRSNMSIFLSRDGGLSWPGVVNVDRGRAQYSSMLGLNATHVAMVYEGGCHFKGSVPCWIRFVVVDISGGIPNRAAKTDDAGSHAVASCPSHSQDCTAELQAALTARASTIIVGPRSCGADEASGCLGQNVWPVLPLQMTNTSSNRRIKFMPGITVQAIKGAFQGGADSLLTCTGVENVTFEGAGAHFLMHKADYANHYKYNHSESRMGLQLMGCVNVSVCGLNISSTGGDGIYVAGWGHHIVTPNGSRVFISTRDHSRDITLHDVHCHDNFRQGLSIISVINMNVTASSFTATNGTPPMFGIVSMNTGLPQSLLKLSLLNCFLHNIID